MIGRKPEVFICWEGSDIRIISPIEAITLSKPGASNSRCCIMLYNAHTL